MTKQEAVSYIERQGWSSTHAGLARTRELLRRLGDPQKTLRFVHVAGSNGKGSVCAMLEAILRAAGYRTGLCISPHIQDFSERIRIGGEDIADEMLIRLTERVRGAAEQMDERPNEFELITALAMLAFSEADCEIVVLEVGMGGALDSTNVIDCPEVAVLTNIGLEHTEYLGDTIGQIARTKAGIIKPGCCAVCYDGAAEATAVVSEVCGTLSVPLRCVDRLQITALHAAVDGQRFAYRGKEYELALAGNYQRLNAATALETIEALREHGWHIGEEAVRTGLRIVQWPARMEVLSHTPLFLLDGGHNPQCAEALALSIRELLPDCRPVFLTGMLRDKDYAAVMAQVLPLAREFVCLTPQSARAMPGGELCAYLQAHGAKASACDTVAEGIRTALDAAGDGGTVVAFGSLYLAGALRTEFGSVYDRWRSEKGGAVQNTGAAFRH